MIEAQNIKFVSITPPAAIYDNASPTTAVVDTLGWDNALIVAYLGATDIAMTALKLQESDASGSGFADITGATFASALPSATDDNGAFAFHVTCGGPRKRYLDLVATAGDGTAGTYFTAFAILFNGETIPDSATERNFVSEVFV